MKRLDKIAGCAVATVLVVLFSVSGDAYAAGGKHRGEYSDGRAGLAVEPKVPAYARLNPADPADTPPYQEPAPEDGVPAQEQVRIVGGSR